jgi:hypothetical protein
MRTYICRVVDANGEVRSSENIEASALAAAVAQALSRLRSGPTQHQIEIWEGNRKVYPAAVANQWTV